MANYDTTTYGGISLKITSITPVKQQKTRKSVIGKTLVETPIIGMGAQQWSLKIAGSITGTTQANLGTNRAAIEALDDVDEHAYVDGIHDGNYYLVPGSLTFEDVSDNAGMYYKYNMSLIEK
jgi:hypothetical protein